MPEEEILIEVQNWWELHDEVEKAGQIFLKNKSGGISGTLKNSPGAVRAEPLTASPSRNQYPPWEQCGVQKEPEEGDETTWNLLLEF